MKFLYIILGILLLLFLYFFFKTKKESFEANDGSSAIFTVPVTISQLTVKDINNQEIDKISTDIKKINANVTTISANVAAVSNNITTITANVSNVSANVATVSANVEAVNADIIKMKSIDNYDINSGKNIDIGTISCKPLDSSYSIEDCAKDCDNLTNNNKCFGFSIEKNLDETKCCLKNINVLNKNLDDMPNIDYYKLKKQEIPFSLKQYNIYFNKNNPGDIINKAKLTNTYTLEDCAKDCLNLDECSGFLHNKINNRCSLKNMNSIDNTLESVQDFDFYYKKNNSTISCDKNSRDKCLFRFYNYDPKTDTCKGPTVKQQYNNYDIRNMSDPEFKDWLTNVYENNNGKKDPLFNDKELVSEYMTRCKYQLPNIKNNVNSKWTCIDKVNTVMRFNKSNNLECLSKDGNTCTIYSDCKNNIKDINDNKDETEYKTVVCNNMDYNMKDSVCNIARLELTSFDKNVNVSCLTDNIPTKPKESSTSYKYIGDFDTFEDCSKKLKADNGNDIYKTITWFNQDTDILKRQCYTSNNDIIKTDNNNAVCGIKTINQEQILDEGMSYVCRPQSKEGINARNVFRYVNKQLRPYGSDEVATSWDPQWNTKFGVINCSDIPIGNTLLKKP
jgi:hypothetical protein